MKIFLRFGFTAIALTFFFNAFAVNETKAQGGILNEILKRMETHRSTLKTLRADVTMDKYNPQLGIHDINEGNVTYLPGKNEREMYIRLDWNIPAVEQLAVIKTSYQLYRPRLLQAIEGNTKQAKGNAKAGNALSFMSMSKEQLNANYTVKYLGEETVSGGIKTWHLQLTPKTANNYKGAELWIDGNGMPIQAKVVENNNDSTTVLLKNLQKNTTINASVFKIKYAPKTKVIKS